jgi:hypothetical protein
LEPAVSQRRALVLIGTGVVSGLVILLLVLLVSLPASNSGLVQKPSTSAATQAFAPVPTETRVPLAAPSRSTALPTPAPTTPPTTIAANRPTPASTVGARATVPARASDQQPTPSTGIDRPPALDVRFAGGAPKEWLDNAPYAVWSDGAYRLKALQAARFVAVGAPIVEQLTNFVVTATLRKTAGPPGGGAGLILRDTGPLPRDGVNQNMNAYVAETGDLGEFGVWRRDGDHWVDLVPWTRSQVVRPGGSPNDLSVRAIGDQLVFSVNGTVLATIQDARLRSGGVGVFVGGDYNEVAVDRFTVQAAD